MTMMSQQGVSETTKPAEAKMGRYETDKGSVFVWPVRVYYEDTDAGGIVFYANYLKFAERARTEMIRLMGFESARLQDDLGVAIAVHHISADYVSPARLDDLLSVHTSIDEIGGASITMHQVIKLDHRIVCDIRVRVVCINLAKGRAERLPSHIRAALASHCSKT